MGWSGWAAAALAGVLLAGAAGAAPQRQVPYWASLSAGQARMRTGPGRNYPAIWLYQRAGLPVKVIEVYPSWRKVEDPDGVTGWMIVNLLSDQRTAMVVGSEQEMRSSPSADAGVRWRVAPGVVGKISHCEDGWCEFDVKGRSGYLPISGLWGIAPGETLK